MNYSKYIRKGTRNEFADAKRRAHWEAGGNGLCYIGNYIVYADIGDTSWIAAGHPVLPDLSGGIRGFHDSTFPNRNEISDYLKDAIECSHSWTKSTGYPPFGVKVSIVAESYEWLDWADKFSGGCAEPSYVDTDEVVLAEIYPGEIERVWVSMGITKTTSWGETEQDYKEIETKLRKARP